MAASADLYRSGKSLPQVSRETGIPISRLRSQFKSEGILRSREEAIRLAAKQGRLGSGNRGKSRPLTDETRAKISRAILAAPSKGVSHKASGYVVYTTGPHKDRGVHVVTMEERIGRRIRPDEEVHHIDRDRSNNDINNLALLTKKAHARLHRFEDQLEGKNPERGSDGRFS